MERPTNIPEAAWAAMTPELRATVISAIQQSIQQAVKTKADEMRSELKLSNLLQAGGREADSAKALLKAATSDTYSIFEIVQRLKALEQEIHDRASQVEN